MLSVLFAILIGTPAHEKMNICQIKSNSVFYADRFVRLQNKVAEVTEKNLEIRNIFQQSFMLPQLLIIHMPMCLFNLSSISDTILLKTLLKTP